MTCMDVRVAPIPKCRLDEGEAAADISEAILSLCSEFHSARELADRLEQKLHLLRLHLQMMVDKGLLVRRFPSARRHPRQAYRANES